MMVMIRMINQKYAFMVTRMTIGHCVEFEDRTKLKANVNLFLLYF